MQYLFHSEDFVSTTRPPLPKARVFLDLEGVMMNFTRDAALALDNMEIPMDSDTGLICPNPVYSRTTNEILYDICHGYDFYKSLKKYPWSDILFEELFKLSKQNVYFLSRQNMWDRESWGGKAHWVWENYGQYGYDHLIMVSDAHESPLRTRWEKSDILIDDRSENIERWCKQGGTGMWWPELDWRVEGPVLTKELFGRLSLLKKLIEEVR